MTPQAMQVLERAAGIAQEFGHDYLGAEHLLLALIADTHGVAWHALGDHHQREALRARIVEILHSDEYKTPTNLIE